jgi:Tfp pilus assembly protein PilF
LLFGRAQLAGGRVAAARSSFEAAAAADPAYADPLVELAALEIDEGKADAAKACLDRALALEPDGTRAQAEAARLLFVAGKTSEAITALEPLAGREPLAAGYLEIARSGDADPARRMKEWRRSRPAQPVLR